MTQKKTKPVETKGKANSGKPVPQKTTQKPVAKPALTAASPAKAAKPVLKATNAVAKAATSPATKKSPVIAAATKKPAASVKPSPAPVAKPMQGAKPNPAAKPDMTKPAVLKAVPVKAAATKPASPAAKPAIKAAPVAAPTVGKPAVAVAKPAVAVAKPAIGAATPAVGAAKQVVAPVVAPAVAARPGFPAPKPGLAVPIGARPAFPVKPAQPGAKAPIAAPVAAAAPSEPKKPVSARHGFKTGEWIVYPAQGVGRIVAIEEQEIAGMKLELFVITFEKDKMTLRVPTGKAATVGMRKLAEEGIVKRAMETLKGKARIKRTMWSRRAQEFEAKINSGDLVSVAEVVRDLYRAESQPEQSYSERLLFERALDRMAREIAAVDKLDERGAAQRIVEVLSKSAKARRPVTEEVTTGGDDEGDEATAAA